ncbi:Tetratricopeptide TPR_1 repeat-containing protein [uncultured Paludibacter sp.]|nr:Tetratricopeptide TPR_1 repeat-containing protein [uncultured Paludibacter sp.]
MTSNEVQNIYKQILIVLSKGKLKFAFEKTRELNAELKSPSINDRLNEMEENYTFMLKYFLEGVKDTERKSLLNKLITQLFSITSQLRDELLTRDSSNFEFSQKRYFPFMPQWTNQEIMEGLKRKEKLAQFESSEGDFSQQEANIEIKFEQITNYLFNYFWLTSNYETGNKIEIFRFIINDNYTDFVAKSLVISGLTLNLWRTFDEQKLELLIDACQSSEINTKQRALVGLCFVLAKYNRFLPYFPAIRNRLVLLTDDTSTASNLQNIIIQIIATTETEEISRKLQEEIFPELMKLRPMMNENLDAENLMNLDEWAEQNPEWEEMMEKSGVADKMKEFADMQMEGADVYMSTFSMLKSFPFFNFLSNWFIPFDSENNAVKPLFNDNEKSLITAFLSSNIMCDSDRYSFCLSVLQMPEMQRNMMKQSFNEAAEQMDEMNKDEALHSPHIQANNISKHYIQGLFRFFKLFPQRNDFADMFSISLILHKSYLFDFLSVDEQLKMNIAEYYFSKKLYNQALELFIEIEKETTPTAALYQKIGYSYQQTSQLFQALEAYKKADLIQPDDYWTLRKMALCYRLTGNAKKALETYKHIDFIKPDQLSVLLQIANGLIEMKKTDEALKVLLKLNEDFEENIKVWRAIILCSFKARNLQQANYFCELLLEKPDLTAYDYVISAHIDWCLQDTKKALSQYKQGLELCQNKWEDFIALFLQDKESLKANGIDEQEIPLILDGIDYSR